MKAACLAVTGTGILGVTGAIANFNFMFGIEKSAMLIASSVILAAGIIALAINGYGEHSTRV